MLQLVTRSSALWWLVVAAQSWVDIIISLIPYDTRIVFDTRYSIGKSSFYKLKLLII